MTYARAIFVIHNMAHQGRGPFVETENLELNEVYREQFRLYDPIGGEHMNIMKAGITNAHRLIAVSGKHAGRGGEGGGGR
jgi:starch synthase